MRTCRSRLSRSALTITLALFALPASVSAATTPERIIVHRHADVTGADRRELRANAGVTFARNLTLPGTELVLADAGEGARALRALNADPDVAWAEPDRRLHASTNDTYFPLQWALENTGQDVLGVLRPGRRRHRRSRGVAALTRNGRHRRGRRHRCQQRAS